MLLNNSFKFHCNDLKVIGMKKNSLDKHIIKHIKTTFNALVNLNLIQLIRIQFSYVMVINPIENKTKQNF